MIIALLVLAAPTPWLASAASHMDDRKLSSPSSRLCAARLHSSDDTVSPAVSLANERKRLSRSSVPDRSSTACCAASHTPASPGEDAERLATSHSHCAAKSRISAGGGGGGAPALLAAAAVPPEGGRVADSEGASADGAAGEGAEAEGDEEVAAAAAAVAAGAGEGGGGVV